jgi:transcriptional regulator of acetoin/glycerol metabolism
MNPVPDEDFRKLRSLARATRGGTLDPERLAYRAYEMGRAVIPPETVNVAELEKAALLRALHTTGNMSAAARLMGIGKTTAYRKAKAYGLT